MIARSAIPRRLRIGEKVYENIPPPTIQDAFETFDILRHAEDETDYAVLRLVLERWLSPSVTSAVLALPVVEQSRVLRRLLLDGSPQPDEEEEEKKKKKKQDPVDLDKVFAQYVEGFRLDPWATYTTTPFPFFLAALEILPVSLAHRTINDSRAIGTPYMKKEDREKLFSDLETVIGVDRKKKKAQEYTEPLSSEELQEERDKLERALNNAFRQ